MSSTKVIRFLVLPALVVSALILAVVIILYATTGGKIQRNYGIVIDAGSSKTGITVYSWPGEKDRSTGLVEQVYYDKIKQPMAKYKNITEFGQFLLPYITKATKEIMTGRLPYTRLYLEATAGMRTLALEDPKKAEILINTTRDTLKSQTTLVVEEVTIMPGDDEALNAWISVNYLEKRLSDQEKKDTIGMLDMGGASAQIAYETQSVKDIDIKLYGYDYYVRSRSDLCYGADEATNRLVALLIKAKSGNPIVDPCLPKNAPERKFKGEDLIKLPCLNGTIKSSFDPKTEYVFTGGSDPTKCASVVNKLLDNNDCPKNFDRCYQEYEPIAAKKEFLAMATYFYSTQPLNLTEKRITKNDFEKGTKFLCSLDYNSTASQPGVDPSFVADYCFRLNYIYATLSRKYKFEGDWTNIKYKKDVNNVEVGWSLGLMINATNAIPAEAPSKRVIATVPFVILVVVCTLILIAAAAYFIKQRYRRDHEQF